jgi:hypothetical protein
MDTEGDSHYRIRIERSENAKNRRRYKAGYVL